MKIKKLVALSTFLYLFVEICLGQMIPDAPIENFRLPVFGEDGYKAWELRGVRGHYLNASNAMIEGMELITFDGGGKVSERNRIKSPKALISFEDSTASGDSALFVTGPNFDIQGQNWEWFGKLNKIVVNSQVRVSFNQELDLLK